MYCLVLGFIFLCIAHFPSLINIRKYKEREECSPRIRSKYLTLFRFNFFAFGLTLHRSPGERIAPKKIKFLQ